MPISFEAWPTRNVPTVGEARWTVQIHRAGAWPGWRWLDRVSGWNWVGEAGFVPLLLMLLGVPTIVVRRVSYATRRRTDWDVLVYRGSASDYRPKDALLVENLSSKPAAVEQAEHVWHHLSEHDRLPIDGT